MSGFPKNVRQIGNVSDSTKIYFEDYVDTYIKQLKKRENREEVTGFFFIGEVKEDEGESYIFVKGAVLMKGLEREEGKFIIGKDTWKRGLEDSETYFGGAQIVGWGLLEELTNNGVKPYIVKVHERLFQKKLSIFLQCDDEIDREELYVYRFNGLMSMRGHYIYYEKNPMMQEYMISKRKESFLPTSETYEDRITKNFRNLITAESPKLPFRRLGLSVLAGVVVLAAVLVAVLSSLPSLQGLGRQLLAFNEQEVVSGSVVEDKEDRDIGGTQILQTKPTIPEVMIDKEGVVQNSEAGAEEEGQVSDKNEHADQIQQEINESVMEYTVKDGDTMSSIAERFYGTIGKVNEIYRYNNLEEGSFIYIGQVIKLP